MIRGDDSSSKGPRPDVPDLLIDPVQQLRDLAVRLHAEGKDPHDLTLEVDRLDGQLGRPVHAVVEIVRQLPGLETFDILEAWRRRWHDPAYVAAAWERYDRSEWAREQRRRTKGPPPSAENRRRARRGGWIVVTIRGHEADIYPLFKPHVEDTARDVLAADLPAALAALKGGG